MRFNPDLQYRCTIIRGKSISRMDDYLPVYAEILNEICPISAEDFNDVFDKKLSRYIKDDGKTIKNHRTENAGQLLGMYYEKDELVYMTERTQQFLKDNDQPAFFKSVCFKFQQPNGSQKIQTIKEKVAQEINFKPYHFVLALLKRASSMKVTLTKMEIAYYVLNSLQVLQGRISVDEVINTIITDRNRGIEKRVETAGKAYSYSLQHINEQFDYLELANLIRKDSKHLWLNTREIASINLFIEDLSNPVHFDYFEYDLDEQGIYKVIEQEWQEYFGTISDIEIASFATPLESLEAVSPTEEIGFIPGISTIDLGDEGENFVLKVEKDRVRSFNPRLINKVNYHGKTKGLGYDITSIEADRNLKNPEFFRYIEVKATKRVHAPDFSETFDTINLTRNEWVAAEQHTKHYYIYRIYFTAEGTFISIINDPVMKNDAGLLYATPTIYRLEFNDGAIDETLEFETK